MPQSDDSRSSERVDSRGSRGGGNYGHGNRGGYQIGAVNLMDTLAMWLIGIAVGATGTLIALLVLFLAWPLLLGVYLGHPWIGLLGMLLWLSASSR